MAIIRTNRPFRIDIDSHGLLARFAEIRHIYDADANVPKDSEAVGFETAAYNTVNTADSGAFPNLTSPGDLSNSGYLAASHSNVLLTDSDGLVRHRSINVFFKQFLNRFLEDDIFARRRVHDSVIDAMTEDSDVNPRTVRVLSDSIKNQVASWNAFHPALTSRLNSDSDVAKTIATTLVDSVNNDESLNSTQVDGILSLLENVDNGTERERLTNIIYQYLDSDAANWAGFWDKLNVGYFDDTASEANRRADFLIELLQDADSDALKKSIGDEVVDTLTTDSETFVGLTSYLRQKVERDSAGNPESRWIDSDVAGIIDSVVDSDLAGTLTSRGFQGLPPDALTASGPNSLAAILGSVAISNIENVRVSRRVFFPGDVDKTIDDDGNIVIGGLKTAMDVNPKFLRDSEFMDFPFPNPDTFAEPTNLNNIKVYVNGILQITNSGDFTSDILVRTPDTSFGVLVFDDWPEEARRLSRDEDDSDVNGPASSPNVRPTVTLKFVRKRYNPTTATDRYANSGFTPDSDSDGRGNTVAFYNALRVYFANIDDSFLDSEDYMFDSGAGVPTITDSNDNAFFLNTDDIVTVEYLTSRIQA